MKRMLSLILTLGMLLALVPASAVASGSFDVVTPPPINPHWEYSDYLLAVWEAPEGADEFTCYDIEIFYSPNGGDDAKTLVDFWNDWEKDTAYAIRADIMAEHGRGYYYFCVRTAATADAPASEWVWSGPYFYSPTGISAVMAAPSGVALSGDSLVWDPIENGLAVISAYYCGEDGTADPTLVGTNYTYGSIQQVQPANFQHNYNAPGVYTYTISAFSDNYLTVGQSETVSVPGTFVVEKKDGPEGPTGLYWSESNSPRWDVITDGSVVYDVEMGIAYDMDTDPQECASWIPLFEGFDGSSEAFLAGALWMEFDYMSQAYMMELGGEFFAFRVRSVPADGNGEPSEWSYSLITPLSNGDDPGQSPEDLPQLTTSNPRWEEETMAMLWDTDQPQQVERYQMRFYWSEQPVDDIPFEDYFEADYTMPTWDAPTLNSYLLSINGTGYYYFRVRAVTLDSNVIRTSEWSALSPALYFTAPSEKAPAPYDLQWGVERWDNSVSSSAPGAISFGGTVTGAYSKFRVALYQMDPFGDLLVATWQTRIYEGEQYATLFPLEDYDFPSGSYYFTVQAIGDGLLTTDSDPVTSHVWEYVRPDLALNVTNPAWDGRNHVWDLNASDHLVRYFDVQFFYSASANPVFDPDDWTDWYTFEPDETATIPTRMLRDYGEGYYAFRVRAISADPTAAFSGQWSEVSPVYHFELSATQLPAPYDLQWHVQRWESNNEHSYPGAISFGGTVLNGNFAEYRVDFYRVGSRVDEYLETLYVDLWSEEPYTTAYPLDEFPEHFTTGTYYFVVTALGDGILYTDSESVVSPMWDYVQPAMKLEASNPVWNSNMSLNWTSGSDLDLLESFQVEFYYNAIANDPADARMVSARSYSSSTYAYPTINNLRNGTGWYFFRVRAVSGDINEAQSSDWSDLSAGFYYTDPGKQITLSNLRWDESTMASQWDANVDESDICYYQVRYYFSETENGNPEQIGSTRFYPGIDSPYVIPSYYLQDYGQGYYRFAVRAYSANPTKVSDNSNYSATSAALHYAGAELQLGTPSALKWNVEYDRNGGESTRMGSIGFKRADPDQNYYEVDIYRVGEDEPVGGSSWSFGSNNSRQYLDVPDFIYDDLPSGTYYFKIRAKGDGINYNHGEWVTSDTWIYTAPAERLDVPTNIRWDDSGEEINILWDSVENAAYYEVSYYFSPTKDGSRESVGGTFDIINTETDLDWIIEDRGIGWYFVKIRAIPQDITQFRLSEWSEFSIGYNLSQLSGDIIGSLEAIDPNAPVADIQQAVSNIPHLDEAMAADKDNSGAVEQIAALERGMGETTVDTSNAPAGFDAADVQVTGAVLNAGADATLEIGSVSASTAPPELNPAQYNNTVTFTMDIPQAEDKNPEEAGLQLAVPVKITLPIPGNINPAFLVVLHYQQSTGEWEELLWPHVYQEGGKWYATFVVDSMSPFALAERQVEAFVRDAGVVVTAYLPTAGEDVRFLCALYRGNGQMVDMTILDPHSDVGQLIPADEVTEDMYVKVLSVDTGNGWQPVSNDQEVAISF